MEKQEQKKKKKNIGRRIGGLVLSIRRNEIAKDRGSTYRFAAPDFILSWRLRAAISAALLMVVVGEESMTS